MCIELVSWALNLVANVRLCAKREALNFPVVKTCSLQPLRCSASESEVAKGNNST